VRNLAVIAVDETANTVSGTSDPYETVYVWQHEPGEQILVEADENGEWLADLSGYYDIHPGSSGRSEIRDEAGNSTAVDWYVPNPRIVASITEDWFYLVEFAPEATVNYSVYESDGVTPIWEDTATTDGSGFVWVDAEGRWDLEPGNYLVVSDGASEKDLVIEGFTFDVFDLTQGLLQGTAPGSEGRRVWTGIGFENDSWSMDVFTDADGYWLADFGAPVPGDYQWVAAQIFDSDGDASEVRPSDVVNWTLVIGNQPDWLSSGITVSAGQSFTVQALGLMNPCSDTYPNGDAICIFYTPVGAEWVVPYENQFGVFPGSGLNFMTLLGRIGDGEPFYVGAGGTFTAEESGPLWFTPNDNLRTDNQGAYSVLVLLEP
jgi:hypothetical protein